MCFLIHEGCTLLLISIASNSNLNIPYYLSCRNAKDLDCKNQERVTSSKSDQTDWIVSFSLCENCVFSNLQLNEMKWGTTKYQGIQNNLLASLQLN